MQTNPVLKKLGYSANDRVVIIHTDDVGMCHASYQAFIELFDKGIVSSAATMIPCSWFPEVAAYCRQNPTVDIGVHLTITSEWDPYRWSPLSTSDKTTGLLDAEGYFHRTSEDAQLYGSPEAVDKELHAQIERAISAGINITHLDSHMFALAHPKYLKSYIQLAILYKVPILFPRLDAHGFEQLGIDNETAPAAAAGVDYLEENGIPLVDYVSWLNLNDPNDRLNQAKAALEQLHPGITHFIIHPSVDTPELRAITPDWKSRVADYHTFMSDEIGSYIDKLGIQVIGYRELKQFIT